MRGFDPRTVAADQAPGSTSQKLLTIFRKGLFPMKKSNHGIERAICQRLVETALACGYTITVHDGEATVLERACDRDAILRAMYGTEEEVLTFHDAEGTELGFVWLVYGEGDTVINDCSDNQVITSMTEAAMSQAGAA